jgi:hypothetical protein
MEIVFGITILLVCVLLGVIIFNYKIGLSNIHLAYIIMGLVFGSIIMLTLMYNPHSECDLMINFNNIPLETLQDKCFKYINF